MVPGGQLLLSFPRHAPLSLPCADDQVGAKEICFLRYARKDETIIECPKQGG